MPRFERGQRVRTVPFSLESNVIGVIVEHAANEDGIESSDTYRIQLDAGVYSEFNACELERADRDAQSGRGVWNFPTLWPS